MLIIPVEQADKESIINDKTGKNPDRNKNATEYPGSSGVFVQRWRKTLKDTGVQRPFKDYFFEFF